MSDVSRILGQIQQGEPSAAERLLPLVYDELRKLAAARLAQEKPGQTLQATALVHEAYLRLVGAGRGSAWDNRGHFFAAAAEAMRRILVEQARRKRRVRHGGGKHRVDLDEGCSLAQPQYDDLLALDEALTRLAALKPDRAEVVKLRFFAGLTMAETARVLGISQPTAERYWTIRPHLALCRASGRGRSPPANESNGPGDGFAADFVALSLGAPLRRRPIMTDLSDRRIDLPRRPGAADARGPGRVPRRGVRRRRRSSAGRSSGCSPPTPRPATSWRPAAWMDATEDHVPIEERPGTVIGPYKLMEQIGEGGHGPGLRGRAAAAGAPQGGAEDHQAGHGHARGHRPLRGRAAGAGADGPSQHRPGVRRRRDRERPAVLRDGAGPGHPDHRLLRPAAAHDPRAAGAVRPGLPGGAARPPQGDHPPRPQAVEHPGRAARRRCRWSR